jgi:hypothetical protein
LGDEQLDNKPYNLSIIFQIGIDMFRIIFSLLLLGTFSMTAQAASVSYIMNLSNALTEPVPYLEVTINDDSDNVNFTVTLLSALTSIADTNFGITSFGFNSILAFEGTIDGPSNWGFSLDKNRGGFGRFDLLLEGTGSTRQNPTLEFDITATGDSVASYYALSSGNGANNTYFVAHVGGFESQGKDSNGNDITSAWFGGGTPYEASVVPVPAAIWLFGTALIGFVGMSRRTRV